MNNSHAIFYKRKCQDSFIVVLSEPIYNEVIECK